MFTLKIVWPLFPPVFMSKSRGRQNYRQKSQAGRREMFTRSRATTMPAHPAPTPPGANEASSNENSLRVCARLRPADTGNGRRLAKAATRRMLPEHLAQPLAVVRRQGAAPTLQAKGLEFSVDQVFDVDQGQAECYEQGVRERVAWALEGHNVTVLAYGQTGSGKTHTMFGAEGALANLCGSDPRLHGIVPRACRQLFEGAAAEARPRLRVRISFIEIHLDRLRDLLAPGRDAPSLSMRESPSQGLVVEGLWHEGGVLLERRERERERERGSREVGVHG